ncbi:MULTISPECIES: transcriptional regulator [Protofrankia]|uniref:transcriptional regulator n=1 Tax=Protofrankia TaxID=2994361 RepID=UPI00069C7DA2|nr:MULTISPECIES: transcriptional regulator [Protofrankia]ONH35684.1 hypothetical protein BL254_10350 [Protofrankia sp. BMG5.30]
MTALSEQEFDRMLGARLRQVREALEISRGAVARRLYVSQKTVASWEIGTRTIPLDRVVALAQAYRTTVPTLIGAASALQVEPTPGRPLTLDMEALTSAPPIAAPLRAYALAIRRMRDDWGQVLTLRRTDIRPLTVIYETDAQHLWAAMQTWRVLRTPEVQA